MTKDIWEKWPRLFPPWSEDDPTTFDSLRRALMNWKVENTPIIDEAIEKAQKWDTEIERPKKVGPLVSPDDYEKLEDKLEAIKMYCEDIIKNAYNDWGGDSAREIAKEVLKILEAEE